MKLNRNEYAEWLDDLPGKHGWHFFITVTAPAGEHRTAKAWRRTMERSMNARYGSHRISAYYWGLERHKNSGEFHAHGLIQVRDDYDFYMDENFDCWDEETDRVMKTLAKNIWRRYFKTTGRSLVVPFDPKQNALWYVTKYCTKDVGSLDLDWEFNANG